MIYKLIPRSIFEIELKEIISYYKSINPSLARQFLIQLKIVTTYIKEYPKGFEVGYKNVRIIKLKQFEYVVHYFINEPENEVILIAISHTSRKPLDFTKR